MAVFPLLANADGYRACDWDLLIDDAARAWWLDYFDAHVATVAAAAEASGYAEGRRSAFLHEIRAAVADLRADPSARGDRLDILRLDQLRDAALRHAGIDDAFRATKTREMHAALAALPARLERLAATPADRRNEELVNGIFAGNMFDMGAQGLAEKFLAGEGPTYDEFLRGVKPRPWLVDDLDKVRLDDRSKCVLFVDNAGGDVCLGMIPLALELADRGAEVVLAANERPALNDITAPELREAADRIPPLADRVRGGRIRIVSTGTEEPLLDFLDVGDELCEAAAGADLVVLEGMGRAIESNWRTEFTCECWRFAVLKLTAIAARRGGELYDCVCRVARPSRR